MINPPEAWLAGMVPRWHAGPSAPYLARSGDTNSAHSARMGVLALWFWPDASRALLVACLTHDLGEFDAGDVPYHAKQDATMRAVHERKEAEARERMRMEFPLHAPDERRLKFLDRLDPYLLAQIESPHLLERPDWRADREWLEQEAKELGVRL